MRGNIVDIKNRTPGSAYIVPEYSSDKWAPDAEHWIHTARHEAGHAVALVSMRRKFGKVDAAFERILIRPGATDSFITKRGRRSDCLGCVEQSTSELALQREDDGDDRDQPLLSCVAELKRKMVVNLEIKIVANLAGPLAEMCSWNEAAELNSVEHDWAWEDNKQEIARIADHVDELRALTGWGSMRSFERQSYELVRNKWSAVVALADELMARHVLGYDEALAIIDPMLS
jgi:hypothetical protein